MHETTAWFREFGADITAAAVGVAMIGIYCLFMSIKVRRDQAGSGLTSCRNRCRLRATAA